MYIDQAKTTADMYLGFIFMWGQTCIGSVVEGKVVFTLFCWGT